MKFGSQVKLNNKAVWFLYVIETDDGCWYTGITTDVKRRLKEHQEDPKKGAKFFRGHKAKRVVFKKAMGSRAVASSWEWHFKRLTRAGKEKAVKTKLASMGFLVSVERLKHV